MRHTIDAELWLRVANAVQTGDERFLHNLHHRRPVWRGRLKKLIRERAE